MLRDGLFHEGFIKGGLILQSLGEPIQADSDGVKIDPERFLNAVIIAMKQVCGGIRNAKPGDALSMSFADYWSRKEQEQKAKIAATFTPQAAPVPPVMPPVTLSTSGTQMLQPIMLLPEKP